MKSGWFWNTSIWQEYLAEYAKMRPECLHEWRSSPLANDHNFSDYVLKPSRSWIREEHQSQVIDLRTHKWSDVRKSYRGIINNANKGVIIEEDDDFGKYQLLHKRVNGWVRNLETYRIQSEWVRLGYALLVIARMTHCVVREQPYYVAASLWIIYQGSAYYASGPSLEKNVQHAVIWKSLQLLKERGVTLVELGQIDGETEKEKNIGKFKAGFGGEAKPFTIVRRIV